MLGCEFEVHEPPELLTYLRAVGARAIRATGVTAEAAEPGRPGG